MQDLIKIGGVLMPPPKTYSVSCSDLDSEDSGRSETGIMFRNRVRAGVYKIQAQWRVKSSDLSIIAGAIAPEAFGVQFFDPTTVTQKTCQMYAGDRSCAMVLNDDEAAEAWWDFSVNFIEY